MVQYHNTGISVLVGQDVRNTRHTIPNCYHVGMLRGMYCSNENDTYSVFRWSYTITTLTNSDLSSHFTEKTRHVWTSVFSFVEIVKSGDGQGRCFPLFFFLIVQNVCFLSSNYHAVHGYWEFLRYDDNVSGQVLDLSACGWTACPLVAKLENYFKGAVCRI